MEKCGFSHGSGRIQQKGSLPGLSAQELHDPRAAEARKVPNSASIHESPGVDTQLDAGQPGLTRPVHRPSIQRRPGLAHLAQALPSSEERPHLTALARIGVSPSSEPTRIDHEPRVRSVRLASVAPTHVHGIAASRLGGAHGVKTISTACVVLSPRPQPPVGTSR